MLYVRVWLKSSCDSLLSVPGQQRKIQDQSDPVPVDKEQDSQECLDGGFGDDVGVEAVAEVDRVDVVTMCISAPVHMTASDMVCWACSRVERIDRFVRTIRDRCT